MRIILLSLIAGANEVVQIHNFSETLSINDSQNIFHSYELNKIVFLYNVIYMYLWSMAFLPSWCQGLFWQNSL